MEQKQVKILSFRAENHNIIKAVMLTPDILQHKLVQLVGESGMGKSTLIEMLQTAVAGTDAIKKKSILEKGYLAQALLLDGDIQLYVGAKVTEYQRGESIGEPKFETFLYAKDLNGAEITPIIDGIKATAGNYVKMLTTDLTFNMPAMFTENQTEHRKLIESLFKPELDRLGADAVVSRIIKAKTHRDGCRILCQGSGSFMESFEREGYTENMLNLIQKPDIKSIEDKIFEKKIERDRLTNGSEDSYKLAEEKAKNKRSEELQTIKDNGVALREKIRIDNEGKKAIYDILAANYDKEQVEKTNIETLFADAEAKVTEAVSAAMLPSIVALLVKDRVAQLAAYKLAKPEMAAPDAELARQLEKSYADYIALENLPLPEIKKEEVDTTIIDEDIKKLESEKQASEATLALYNRYQLWKNWIEAKGLYEKELDVLRKMYAGIDTGVAGMHIVPVETETDRVEVWIQYNGCYDKEFFVNPNLESRFMFQYSSFQCSAIGVMLQAARLNLKPKALRLAIVDDVAFTSKGLAVLSKMCEDFDVQLITARTDDYNKEDIPDGEVIVEGGEVFFNKI